MSVATVFSCNSPVSDKMHKILGGGDANKLFSRVQLDLPKLNWLQLLVFGFICLISFERQPLTLRNALFTHETTHVVDTM